MKAAWAVGAAALVSVPILALPAEPSSDTAPPVARAQAVSELGAKGDHMITSCQPGQRTSAVAIEGFEFGKGLSIRAKPATPCRVEYRAG